MCYRASDPRFRRSLGEGGCLRPLVCALFCPLLQGRAISSVVERLLHTQEVAGSNPASRILLLCAVTLKRDIRIERSPRRRIRGSNPLSRTILFICPRGK